MAITIVNQWHAGNSLPAGYTFPEPAGYSQPVNVANSDGNWLIALLAWQNPAGYTTTMAAGDDARNKWEPLGAPVGTSSPGGLSRCSIWAAPNARPATTVMAAPSGFTPAYEVLVLEVAGMGPGMNLEAVVTNLANGAFPAGPLTASLPAVAQQALVIAVGASDLTGTALNLTGTGWTALTAVSTTNGSDHTADMQLVSGYQVTSGATSATWTPASGTMDLACAMVALTVNQAAPAGPAQNWPLIQFQAAFGAGVQTPWDQLAWTDLTPRYRGTDGQRGKQYELDSVQAGTLNFTLSNNDAALTPGNTSSPYYQGIAPWTGANGASLFLSQAYAWSGQNSMLMVPDGVTSGPFAASERVPVIAGSVYTADAAVMCPQGWAAGVQPVITWYDASGAPILSSAGLTVALNPGQWAYIPATATAPTAPNAAYAVTTIQAVGTPPSTTLFCIDFATIASPFGMVLNKNWNFGTGPTVYTPVRLLATWAGRANVVWRGFMERWPQALTSSRYQVSNAVATDMWATLTALLDTCARAETLIDNPAAFWPLDDPAGSTMAADISGNAGPLVVTPSKFGTGAAGTYSFGANSNAFAGNPSGTTWQQSGLAGGGADAAHGYCLKYQAANLPKISQGVTISCWVNFTLGSSNQPNDELIIWVIRGSAGAIAQLWGDYSFSGEPIGWYLTVWDQRTGLSTDTQIWNVGTEIGWVNLAVTLTTGSWTATIDGGAFTPTTASGTCNLSDAWQWISFGGSADQIYHGGFSNLSLALCTIYPTVAQPNRIVAGYWASHAAMAGDAANWRIERLLSYGRSLVPRRIAPPCNATQGATDIQGQATAQNITNIAESDSGLLYVDRCGYLAYDSRQARWNLPPVVKLGELAEQILNANWDFETGTAPWTATNATISQSSAQAYTGTFSLLITPASSSNSQAWAASELVPVTGNTVYQASLRAYSPGGWSSFSASVNWYDATRTYLSTSSASVSLAAATRTLVSNTFTSPANAAYASLVPTLSGNPGPSNTAAIDRAMLLLTGEVPYLADFASDFDPSQVYDDITLNQLNGLTITAKSATSIAQYGDQTLQQTIYLQDVPVIGDLANWILGAYGTPSTRIPQVTIDPSANPAAWHVALDLDVGNVVQVSRRLMGTQTVIAGLFEVQSIALSAAPGKFQVRLGVTPYFGVVLATNDPQRGLPNGSNALAF